MPIIEGAVKPQKIYGPIVWENAYEAIGPAAPAWAMNNGASLALDTVNSVTGEASVAITNTGNGDASARIIGINLDLSAPGLWMELDYTILPEHAFNCKSLLVILLDGAGCNRVYYLRIAATGRSGFCKVRLPVAQYSAVAGPINMAAITKIITQFSPAPGTICTVVPDRIRFFHPPAGAVGRVVFSFDGTMADCIAAARYLENHGARGVFYTNQEYLNKKDHVTLAQLKGLQRKDHIIGIYTGSLRDPATGEYYPNWAGSTAAQKLDQISQVRAFFDANGVDYYNFLSVSGTGGWTEKDDDDILGPLVDLVGMMDSDGAGLKHIDLPDPRAPLSFFNGASYYGAGGDMRLGSQTLGDVFDLAMQTGGVVHYGAHLNGNSNAHGTDNLATFCAAVDLAVSKNLKIVTPADLIY